MVLCAVVMAATVGCGQRMDNQPRKEPLEAGAFHEDETSARALVPGTVPRGERIEAESHYDPAYTTGRVEGEPIAGLPERVLEEWDTDDLLERGRERYEIFCAHCHDLTGSGNGIVPRRGFYYPPSYHSRELRNAPLGRFFTVITGGTARMPALGTLIPVEDRWAITAYVRALQFSQYAPVSELSEQDRRQLPE